MPTTAFSSRCADQPFWEGLERGDCFTELVAGAFRYEGMTDVAVSRVPVAPNSEYDLAIAGAERLMGVVSANAPGVSVVSKGVSSYAHPGRAVFMVHSCGLPYASCQPDQACCALLPPTVSPKHGATRAATRHRVYCECMAVGCTCAGLTRDDAGCGAGSVLDRRTVLGVVWPLRHYTHHLRGS